MHISFFSIAWSTSTVGPNKIKVDEESYKNVLICTGHMIFKDPRYIKSNNVNPLYFIINKVNGYFGEIDGNKYLTLVPTIETKEKMKKYEERCNWIGDIIRSITNSSDNYDAQYM